MANRIVSSSKATSAKTSLRGKRGAHMGDSVSISVLPQSHTKAPTTDPYLKPETVTRSVVSVGGVSLPPILSGVQPGLAIDGQPKDYTVRVIWAARRHIDDVLTAFAQEHPENSEVVAVVRAFMSTLDTVRDEVKLRAQVSKGYLQKSEPDTESAIECIDRIVKMLGRWDDEHRLSLH